MEVSGLHTVPLCVLTARFMVRLGRSRGAGRRGQDRSFVQAGGVHSEEQKRRSDERSLRRVPRQRWLSVLLQVGGLRKKTSKLAAVERYSLYKPV